jgi:hypothetical protein
MKYSQVLTQVIATCITIKSFATISFSNSLSLVGEFKLKLDKINCIGGKWNGISQRKMKWDSQKPKKKFNSLGTPK